MRVELRIESLVLHGVAAVDRHEVAASLHRELARLVEAGTAPIAASSRTAGSLDGGDLESHGGDPQRLGVATARAVYDAIAGLTSGAWS